jgi:hypothetical protein
MLLLALYAFMVWTGKLAYLVFYYWRLNQSFFPTGQHIFGIISEQKLSPSLDISGQPCAAFRVLRSYTVSFFAFTLVKDILEEPNHLTMNAGLEVKILSPTQDYFCFSLQATKACGGVKV